MTCFWTWVAIALAFVVIFETELAGTGLLAHDRTADFFATTVMELLSLVAIFTALRMFKKPAIRRDLKARKEQALARWGLLRICILGIPLQANVLLYYLFMNTTYGYLALIFVLCLPFVYPTLNRCLTETEIEEEV